MAMDTPTQTHISWKYAHELAEHIFDILCMPVRKSMQRSIIEGRDSPAVRVWVSKERGRNRRKILLGDWGNALQWPPITDETSLQSNEAS